MLEISKKMARQSEAVQEQQFVLYNGKKKRAGEAYVEPINSQI